MQYNICIVYICMYYICITYIFEGLYPETELLKHAVARQSLVYLNGRASCTMWFLSILQLSPLHDLWLAIIDDQDTVKQQRVEIRYVLATGLLDFRRFPKLDLKRIELIECIRILSILYMVAFRGCLKIHASKTSSLGNLPLLGSIFNFQALNRCFSLRRSYSNRPRSSISKATCCLP